VAAAAADADKNPIINGTFELAFTKSNVSAVHLQPLFRKVLLIESKTLIDRLLN